MSEATDWASWRADRARDALRAAGYDPAASHALPGLLCDLRHLVGREARCWPAALAAAEAAFAADLQRDAGGSDA